MMTAISDLRRLVFAQTRRAVLMLSGALGCASPTEAPRSVNANGLEPLPSYRTWWSLVERCATLDASFDEVRWYVATRVNLWDPTVKAVWLEDGNRIVLGKDVVTDGRVVRHEILHALLRRSGHPPEYFAGACAALVACEFSCAPPEAQRGVPQSARLIPPSMLDVTMRLEPAQPSRQIDGGWFRLAVTATNPLPEAVWVSIPGLDTFSFSEATQAPAGHPPHEDHGITRAVPAVERRWAFHPGEARSTTFDVLWPAGSYNVRISFGDTWNGLFLVTVDP